MSERYGVYTDTGKLVYADPGGPQGEKGYFAGSEAQANAFAVIMRRRCGVTYEVRPYPVPESKPAAHFGTLTTPEPVRHIPVIDAAALSFALFASDIDVDAFVRHRCDTPDRFDAIAQIAFDRDERGWATRARARAARVIARMK